MNTGRNLKIGLLIDLFLASICLSCGSQGPTNVTQEPFLDSSVALATGSSLHITEIMYNPKSEPDNAWEWIEVYNSGSVPISLQGYVLDDNDDGILSSANVGAGTVLPQKSAILYNADLSKDGIDVQRFLSAWGSGIPLIPVTRWSALNDDGDHIGLWSSIKSYGNRNFSNALDDVDYEDSGSWPRDNNAASIYLTSLSADNAVGSSWRLSSTGTTPVFSSYLAEEAGGNSGDDIGSPGPNLTRYHRGACDASAALPSGTTTMIVANDEDQILRFYPLSSSGNPSSQIDFTSSLGLTDISGGRPREVDLEGSTQKGSTLYWLASHSNSGTDGSFRPNRYRLFATTLRFGRLSYVGRYDKLRQDLLNWSAASALNLSASAASGVIPEDPSGRGFNIEGFTLAPDGVTAYVGFRAPLVPPSGRAQALIAPILNLSSLVTGNPSSGPAQLGSPIQLDLGGRGIRSMECNSSGCLIVAGPVASNATPPLARDFKLFTWSGRPGDPPRQRAADLTGMNPEGIVKLPTGSLTSSTQIQLISDNGDTDWYNNGQACKDLSQSSQKKFRSDRVILGD
jgi:hypothetical protein